MARVIRSRRTRRTRRPAYRRTGRRPRARVNKSSRYSVVKSLNYNGFHCFKEKMMTTLALTCDASGDCAATTELGTGWSDDVYQFQLNTLGDVTHYQALFEQYRITGVKLKIFPNANVATTDGTTTGTDGTGNVATAYAPTPIPKFWWNYDFNETTNPATIEKLMEKNVKTTTFDRPITIYIKNPTILSTTTLDPSEDISTTNMIRRTVKSPWLNLTDEGIACGHLGVEFGLFGAQPTARYTPRMVVSYYFQCKGQN